VELPSGKNPLTLGHRLFETRAEAEALAIVPDDAQLLMPI
jgi:hypothetical protein